MLLRDDRQMAICDIEAQCIETADQFGAAADRTEDTPLKALFVELAGQRRQLASDLAEHIRALGDLPQAPDPDKEQLDGFFSTVKSLLSGDERGTLIDERLAGEAQLEEFLDVAQRLEPSSALADMLVRIRRSVELTRHRLHAARSGKFE
jgi:uncharacterized protein (TIGR02284 family)